MTEAKKGKVAAMALGTSPKKLVIAKQGKVAVMAPGTSPQKLPGILRIVIG